MGTPVVRTWQDVEGMIGVQRESSTLDFKSELSGRTDEIAKDIAAMTVEGGVLIYGVREDKATGLADSISVIELAGVEERVRQVTADLIDPVPAIELREIRVSETDTRGVVVVVVPKSSKAPHMVNGRFVVRHGTTTRWMSEREVGLAYERRARRSRPLPLGDLLSDVGRLPGLDDVRAQSVFDGFGQLRVSVRPEDEMVEHPSGVRLKAALEDAVAKADDRATSRLAVYSSTTLLTEIRDWSPVGTEGWAAGWAGGDEARLSSRPTGAAVLIYPTRVTTQVTIPTVVHNDDGDPSYLCAHEGKVAAELYASLSFAAAFFAALAPVDLHVGLHLAGFAGAVSYHASHAHAAIRPGHLPVATHGDLLALVVSQSDLDRSPESYAQRLLDRWLLAFYEGPPLLEYVAPEPQDATRLR